MGKLLLGKLLLGKLLVGKVMTGEIEELFWGNYFPLLNKLGRSHFGSLMALKCDFRDVQ